MSYNFPCNQNIHQIVSTHILEYSLAVVIMIQICLTNNPYYIVVTQSQSITKSYYHHA